MTRVSLFGSPFLLGFEEFERLIDRTAKNAAETYPPYNIERFQQGDDAPERLRITLAVAGFAREDLEITVEDNQLSIRGCLIDEDRKAYLHRGIATRQFQRTFVLADGMEVKTAALDNGLLSVDLERKKPGHVVRRIEIKGSSRS